MKITPPCVVSLSWVLKDAQNDELDVLDEPVDFLVGGTDLLASIEAALQGKLAGDKIDLSLEPADAFGDYDEHLLFLEPLDKLPSDITEGMAFEGLPEGCNPEAPKDRIYFVSDIYPEHAVLDGNHPLAGMGLRLHLTVHEVREALEDEIGRGTLGVGFFNMQIEPVETKGPDGSNPTVH